MCFRAIRNSFLQTVHILLPNFLLAYLFLIDLRECFLGRENEPFVHDKSCKYFHPVCHFVASFGIFFFPMHNFYIVEGINQFHDFVEFV